MYQTLLALASLTAAGLCGWLYWQIQQAQTRIREHESDVREKALLVGELADELTMASQYLYEVMDECLARVERFEQAASSSDAPYSKEEHRDTKEYRDVEETVSSAKMVAEREADNPPETSGDALASDENRSHHTSGSRSRGQTSCGTGLERETQVAKEQDPEDYHPHFKALKMATEGVPLVDIARHTSLGVEELRLLLRFQEELTLPA